MSGSPTNRPENCGDKINLREFFTLWIERLEETLEERDRRYEDRFKAQETAVANAFAAQKELTNSVFNSSEKAISKAESAQSEYNLRSNEFRGQLDDQAKRLMSRDEALGRFEAIDHRISEIKDSIANLRESRSESGGQRGQSHWMIGLAVTIGIAGASAAVSVVIYLLSHK